MIEQASITKWKTNLLAPPAAVMVDLIRDLMDSLCMAHYLLHVLTSGGYSIDEIANGEFGGQQDKRWFRQVPYQSPVLKGIY